MLAGRSNPAIPWCAVVVDPPTPGPGGRSGAATPGLGFDTFRGTV